VTDDVPPQLLGQKSVRIDVTETSPISWHVMLVQPGFGIEAGRTYTYSFWVKSSQAAPYAAAIEKDHPPHGGSGLFERMTATPRWQQVVIDFTPGESDDKTRFSFTELAGQKATLWFAAPSFSLRPEDEGEPEPGAVSFYNPDYLEDQAMGDDPYRYYRW
jgi:hypothetical protein